MRTHWRLLGVLGMAGLALFLIGAPPGGANPQQTSQPKNKVKTSETEDEGEKKFRQNCSRCHNAPEGFSSRISGTIIRHMRVRASLSQKDAEAIFRYLNPQ